MLRRALIGGLLLASFGCQFGRRSLPNQVRNALISAAPEVQVREGEDLDTLLLSWPDGRTARMHLDSLRRHCELVAADCDAAIDLAVRRALAPEPAIERDKVSVTVKPSAYLNAAAQQASVLYSQPFVGELRLVLVQDLGDALGFLTIEELREANLQGAELAEQGLAREALRCAQVEAKPAGGALRRLDDDDASPCLLIPAYWSALAAKLGVETLRVSVPSATTVWVLAGDAESERAELARRTRNAYASAVRPLSAAIYRWSLGTWYAEPQ